MMLDWQNILISIAMTSECAIGSPRIPPSIRIQPNVIFVNEVSTLQKLNADELEHKVRVSVPMGSKLAAVQEFLNSNRIEFSFEAGSRTIFAIIRRIGGSNILVSKSLALKFHFDDNSILRSIDSNVVYTGP